MANADAPDWEAIERDYRAGMLSVREIGRKHGVAESGIRKKAKAGNWTRPLAHKVRERIEEKLVRIDGAQSGAHPQRARTDETTVEIASSVGVEVRLTHRRDLSQLRAIGATLATRLAAHLNGEPVDGPCLGEKETPGDLFEKLARVKARLIPLERQAHNLDDAPDGIGTGTVTRIELVAPGYDDSTD